MYVLWCLWWLGRASDGSRSPVQVSCQGRSPTLVVDAKLPAVHTDTSQADTPRSDSSSSSSAHGKLHAVTSSTTADVWAVKQPAGALHDLRVGKHEVVVVPFIFLSKFPLFCMINVAIERKILS